MVDFEQVSALRTDQASRYMLTLRGNPEGVATPTTPKIDDSREKHKLSSISTASASPARLKEKEEGRRQWETPIMIATPFYKYFNPSIKISEKLDDILKIAHWKRVGLAKVMSTLNQTCGKPNYRRWAVEDIDDTGEEVFVIIVVNDPSLSLKAQIEVFYQLLQGNQKKVSRLQRLYF
ncbi:hypothetical protein AA313_de0203711 [Arthrobotrys entomopaga]|nr:hypothetical protein AA313_de0203711 [Arthrobotrys entomopaga]